MKKDELFPDETYIYVREGEQTLDALSNLLVELGHAGYERVVTATLSRGTSVDSLNKQLRGLMLEGFDGVVAISLLGVDSEETALEACCRARDAAYGAEVRVVYVLAAEGEMRLARAALLAGLKEMR